MAHLGAGDMEGWKISCHESEEEVITMKLKHRVSINISRPDRGGANILCGGEVKLRERILRFLFGEQKKVLVIAPGDSVFDVEIREQSLGRMFDEYLKDMLTGAGADDTRTDAGEEAR